MDFWNDVMGSDWGIQGTKSSQHIKAKKKKKNLKNKLWLIITSKDHMEPVDLLHMTFA